MPEKIIIFIPSIEDGGVEKNLFIITNYLSQKNKNTCLITCSDDKINRITQKNLEVISPKFINFEKSSRGIKYFICLYLLLRIFLREKKTLILSFQANLYCSILCKLFGRKIIIRSNSSSYGWEGGYLKKRLFSLLFSLPDEIIVNSEDLKREYKKKFSVNPICIFNPLDRETLKQKSNLKTKKYFGLEKKILRIINIGRLVDQKNQIDFLEGLNRIKDSVKFKALILGKGSLKLKYLNFIKNNNLTNHIKIIDFQENPYNILKQADLLILTSKYEGMPNVILEALALNVDVISSDCPTGPRELINKKWLYKLGKTDQLSKKIIDYYKDYFIKKKFSKKISNNNRVLKKFDFYENLKKYDKVIKKFLNKS
mgnify:CR=1 FL=1